ncbi:hypothetical protein [Streptomyces pseudovenezuelae]|uniref:Histidine kinase n=1 Tax=Streptomyces pseudovenezuelae TaxID=67350 RepID=A0ABT6M0Y1_9ACTN|nr:hypothetical protein [Streptomyces pseudovenezuelae]MDH6222210.1 hypothetical protein [Streptomyces pseudovenezuelae]
MEHGGITVIPDLAHEETTWAEKEVFRANRHAAGNARLYTLMYLRWYLSVDHGFADIEDLAAIGHVLVANAVAYSGVPEYAEIPMQWALLQSGAFVIQVRDAQRDFPEFDKVLAWEPAEGERPRGLWTARQLGAEVTYAPKDSGKIVQAVIMPRSVPA